jgi:multisubunit Na+/H+ antiporter MnhF subunit
MSASLHPAAPHHLPPFVTAPGESDVLMVVMAVFLVVAVLAVGLLFLRLHTLPERIAHKSHKLQFEIVAVLGLLALFTHQHIFWVAGLLLALIDFPEFGRPLGRIANSLETIAGGRPQEGTGEMPDGMTKAPDVSVADIARREVDEGPDGTPAPSRKPKERIHA